MVAAVGKLNLKVQKHNFQGMSNELSMCKFSSNVPNKPCKSQCHYSKVMGQIEVTS